MQDIVTLEPIHTVAILTEAVVRVAVIIQNATVKQIEDPRRIGEEDPIEQAALVGLGELLCGRIEGEAGNQQEGQKPATED